MEASKLKNMVVLKNLPSNIIEEAIVILKENKKLKKLQKVEKNKKMEYKTKMPKEKDYVLREAEMLVSSYIDELETKKSKKEITNKKEKNKIKKLKMYAYITSIIIFVETIMLITK